MRDIPLHIHTYVYREKATERDSKRDRAIETQIETKKVKEIEGKTLTVRQRERERTREIDRQR